MKITRSSLNQLIRDVLLEYKDASSKFKMGDFGDSALSAGTEDSEPGGKDDGLYAKDEESASEMADSNQGKVVMIADSKKKRSDYNYGGKIVTDPASKRYQYKLDDKDEDDIKIFIIRSPKTSASIKNPEEVDADSKKEVFKKILKLFSS